MEMKAGDKMEMMCPKCGTHMEAKMKKGPDPEMVKKMADYMMGMGSKHK